MIFVKDQMFESLINKIAVAGYELELELLGAGKVLLGYYYRFLRNCLEEFIGVSDKSFHLVNFIN